VVGASERELIADHQLKPVAALGGSLEHARVRALELANRQRVSVAAQAVIGGERRGQTDLPAMPEPLDVAMREALADPGQRVGVID
jgi:hypothetical protein